MSPQWSLAKQRSSEEYGKSSRLIILSKHICDITHPLGGWFVAILSVPSVPDFILPQKLSEGAGHQKSGPLLDCRVLNGEGLRYKKSALFIYLFIYFTVPRASSSKKKFY